MKRLTQYLILIISISCNNSTHETVLTSKTDSTKFVNQDSFFSLSIVKNVSDTSIINTTDRTVEIHFLFKYVFIPIPTAHLIT
jgi:hypothetical protein